MVRSVVVPLLVLAALPLVGGARVAPSAAASPKGPSVRVLLLEAPLVTVGAAGKQGLQLRDQQGRPLLRLDPGSQLRVRRAPNGLTLEALPKGAQGNDPSRDQARLTTGLPSLGDVEQPIAPRLLPLQELRLEAMHPKDLMVLKQHRYRGTLLLRPEGEGLQAINRLPLETYLAGVVGSEMPGTWPLAALEAQAVASRTYALQQLRPKAPFDLKATVASQVYKGVETESGPVRQAVATTRGQVLMHGQHLINAVFHSSSGGVTENSGDLWTRQLPYLVSVPDFDTTSPVSQWEKDFSPEALRQAFAEIGGVTTIQPLQSSKTGRIQRAKVVGPGGELVLSGKELRERLGLRSTLVTFRFEPAGRLPLAQAPALLSWPPSPLDRGGSRPEAGSDGALPGPVDTSSFAPNSPTPSPGVRLVVTGRGYGHGVGLSQWGAYALALRGKSYEDILRHYYRGAVLRTI